MKVVFLEEVEGTAHTGDVKNVADGFARNYLLPRRLAAPANEHYISVAQAKATKEAKRQERLDEEATKHLLPLVDGKSISIEVRVGDQGKLFGSVTGRDIAAALKEATKVELEYRQIALQEPIRELGAREVTVKLTRNVLATITVSVEPLGGLQEQVVTQEVEAQEEPAADEPTEGVAETAEGTPEATEPADEPEEIEESTVSEETAGDEAEAESEQS